MMNPDEIARLAALGNALRPDWRPSSLRTFIERNLAHVRGYGDTAVALTWICTKTKTETPRLLLEPGIWWQAAFIDGDRAPKREPYDPHSFCHTCGKPEGICRRNENSGHEFESAADHARRLAHGGSKAPLRELIPSKENTA